MKIQTKKAVSNGRQGFTLIELLVVIAIIGILSSVVLASLNSARIKARDAKRIADAKQVRTALDMYYNDNDQQYPATLAELVSGGQIPSVPIDPLNTGNYIYQYTGLSTDGGTTCGTYHLGTTLEDTGNIVFDSDSDAAAVAGTECTGSTVSDFEGDGVDFCGTGAASSTDACYDFKP